MKREVRETARERGGERGEPRASSDGCVCKVNYHHEMAGVSRRIENDQLYGRQRKREPEHEASAKTAQYCWISIILSFPLY